MNSPTAKQLEEAFRVPDFLRALPRLPEGFCWQGRQLVIRSESPDGGVPTARVIMELSPDNEEVFLLFLEQHAKMASADGYARARADIAYALLEKALR